MLVLTYCMLHFGLHVLVLLLIFTHCLAVGVEVKSGETFEVNLGDEKVLHLSQVIYLL